MNEEPRIPIALIDDHTLVRKGLVELIENLGGYHVALEAGNGREFINALPGAPPVALAIVDLNMPVMDGYETIAWIHDNRPDIRPLALTFDGTEQAVMKAVRSGSRGFILKDIEPSELKTALDHIMASGYYHSDLVHGNLLESWNKRNDHDRLQAQIMEQVSSREMEFIKLVCSEDEFTYDQIGERMGVTRRTVDGYRETLFMKLGIKSKVGLVLFAIRWGLIKV